MLSLATRVKILLVESIDGGVSLPTTSCECSPVRLSLLLFPDRLYILLPLFSL